MLDPWRCSQGGETSEANLCLQRTVLHRAVLMQTEVRAQWTFAPRESCRRRTAHL